MEILSSNWISPELIWFIWEEEQLKNNALNKESIRKKRALKKTILNKKKAQRSGKKISKKRKFSLKSGKEATEYEEKVVLKDLKNKKLKNKK